MNILVVCPYKAKLLRAVEAVEKINIGDVLILGDFRQIMPIINEEKIKLKCNICNIVDEEKIVTEAKKLITDETIVIFGDVLEHNQKRILGVDASEETNYFYVIDLLELRHFIFVSNYSKKRYLDFEDKRKAISAVFGFMKTLGVKKSNCALITDKTIKSDILEVNLIRMILKDDMARSINMLNPCKLSDVFDHNSEWNVFNKNVNMLIFKNYDISRTFIDTLRVFSSGELCNCSSNKIASICSVSNKLFIDTTDSRDEQDILFSVLLVSKYISVAQNMKIKFQVVNY